MIYSNFVKCSQQDKSDLRVFLLQGHKNLRLFNKSMDVRPCKHPRESSSGITGPFCVSWNKDEERPRKQEHDEARSVGRESRKEGAVVPEYQLNVKTMRKSGNYHLANSDKDQLILLTASITSVE